MPLTTIKNWAALRALEARIKAILPEQYQESYEDVEPVSMGSAAIKYGDDGKVAWDDIWDTFCDLAMAGGPPHKGKLLQPGTPLEIAAQPEAYKKVVDELCRGVRMVSDLDTRPSDRPGWIRVECESPRMAEWLVRAIVMENVSAWWDGWAVELPAGPAYRVEKEIKNVVTSIAKTCHYWLGHVSMAQAQKIGDLFAAMAAESPLLQPAIPEDALPKAVYDALHAKIAEAVHAETGLPSPAIQPYAAWHGVECSSEQAAIWIMRAMVVKNVLARREDTLLFLALNPASDPDGQKVIQPLIQVHAFAKAKHAT